MTEIYTHRTHADIPKRVRSRISANVEAVIERLGDNPDYQEEMIEDLIDIAYDAYHVGWQSGFIDDTQPNPSIVDRLNDAKAHIDVGIMEMAKDLASFNPGGTK